MQAFEKLEIEWATFNELDPKGMVACSSGTAALHLALEALQLPQGSQCIVPDYTMIACPRAVTMAGLVPVFVDCDERLLMDLELIPSLRVVSPAVIMAVHIYGRQVSMDAVYRMTYNGQTAHIVEDLAEAHGVKPHPFTNAACWSFYRNKVIAGEEGGAVWFRNNDHAKLARQLRSLGFTDAHDYTHIQRGHNYRMSNLHASSILNGQGVREWSPNALKWYGENVIERRQIESWYESECPPQWRMPYRDAPWVYDFRVTSMMPWVQDSVVKSLREAGIEARHGFKPCSGQQEYMTQDWRRTGPYNDNAIKAAREVIYLPITPGTSSQETARRAFEIARQIVGQ